MQTAPCFITNYELDRFLGGGAAGQRQRQRLRKAGLLPEPVSLGRVHRFNIAVFPRFVLAGLIRDLADLTDATDVMAKVAARTFLTPAFADVKQALRESVLALDDWSFDSVVAGVVDRAEDAVRDWTQVVEEAQNELAERFNLSFVTDLAIVERVVEGAYVISVGERASEQVPFDRVVTAAEEGRAVALERVRVRAKELDYVMPLETIADKEDRELAGWFSKMMEPAANRVAVEVEPSHHERLPYARLTPRRARWHGASTMTRLPAAG